MGVHVLPASWSLPCRAKAELSLPRRKPGEGARRNQGVWQRAGGSLPAAKISTHRVLLQRLLRPPSDPRKAGPAQVGTCLSHSREYFHMACKFPEAGWLSHLLPESEAAGGREPASSRAQPAPQDEGGEGTRDSPTHWVG